MSGFGGNYRDVSKRAVILSVSLQLREQRWDRRAVVLLVSLSRVDQRWSQDDGINAQPPQW